MFDAFSVIRPETGWRERQRAKVFGTDCVSRRSSRRPLVEGKGKREDRKQGSLDRT